MAQLLTLKELADYLQVPTATVYQWRHRGEGPPGFRVGRGIRFRPEDVESWLAEHADKTREPV